MINIYADPNWDMVSRDGINMIHAAEHLKDLILKDWPVVEGDFGTIHIIPNAVCHSGRNRKIDLLLLAKFPRPIEIIDPIFGEINIVSLSVVIEVKDISFDSGNIKFEGTKVLVRYKDNTKWKDATEQADEQVLSFRKYVERNQYKFPWTDSFVWLRNVPEKLLPKRPHNILGGDFTWNSFISALIDLRREKVQYRNNKKYFDHIGGSMRDNDIDLACVVKLFTQKIQLSPLDRKKVETVFNQRYKNSNAKYFTEVGEKLLVFRGNGGTGKTGTLLLMAYMMAKESDSRVLLLTYNKSLVSDIQRMLAAKNLDYSFFGSCIHIENIHKYIYGLCEAFDIKIEDDFIKQYTEYKEKLLNGLSGFSIDDLDVYLGKKSAVLDWDYIFIDECQDWPSDERDILYSIFDYKKFVLADGKDQFVRSQQRITWDPVGYSTVKKSDFKHVIGLRLSLRLKLELVNFAVRFSAAMELPEFDLEPNYDLPGGNIEILSINPIHNKELMNEIVKNVYESGNYPVDILICLPPHHARYIKNKEGQSISISGNELIEHEFKVWDGTIESNRGETYPIDLDEIRLVQYDSCRGLEAWTVICIGFDKFIEYKIDEYINDPNTQKELYKTKEQLAKEFAFRWAMIPMTRAIDTVLIHLENPNSWISKLIIDSIES